MGFEVGKKFWIAATAVIVVVTLFVVAFICMYFLRRSAGKVKPKQYKACITAKNICFPC